jgi:hypothetical protein
MEISDAEPQKIPAQSNAAAHVQHLRKRIRELEAEKRALYVAPPRLAALAQSDAEPYEIDTTKVICPNCTHQFKAISVADQKRLRAQSDSEPVAWRWKFADSGHWFATENKLYADLVRENGTEVEPLYTAPPRPDTSAGLSVEQHKRLVQLEARVEALERM